MKQIIFYGAGGHANAYLELWIEKGIVPVCFVDEDKSKHNAKVRCKHGEFVILPLSEAILRYPEYEIFLSVDSNNFPIVMKYLLGKGIPKSRFYSSGGPKHCPLLGTNFVVHGPGLQTCCTNLDFCLPRSGCTSDDIAKYAEHCLFLFNALNEGLYTPCVDCIMIQDGKANHNLQMKTANLSSGLIGGERCNLKCSYCTYGEEFGSTRYGDSVYDILQYLSEHTEVEIITYASGEVTVSDYRDDIFKLWKAKKWKGSILTNAMIYSEDIAHLLQEKLITINCSIDAGTSDTFRVLKGVDGFASVIENLERYASISGGRGLIIKYILLDGVNCNYTDIIGFLSIAQKINAEVMLSRDVLVRELPMTRNEETAFALFIEQCQKDDIDYTVVESCFLADLAEIREITNFEYADISSTL